MPKKDTSFKSWAENAAFKDGEVLRTWYHGTDTHEPFNIFTRYDESSLGFHFGDHQAANSRLKQIFRMVPAEENEGLIIPVYCRAEHPLRLPDLYTWGQTTVAQALLNAGIIDEDDADFLIESCSADMIFAAIEEAGHDCVVYSNVCENGGEPSDSIMVWRSELLKSLFASVFDKNDPRIMPQLGTVRSDLVGWERQCSNIETEKEALRAFRNERQLVGSPTL